MHAETEREEEREPEPHARDGERYVHRMSDEEAIESEVLSTECF
jgi:hypothetical protein